MGKKGWMMDGGRGGGGKEGWRTDGRQEGLEDQGLECGTLYIVCVRRDSTDPVGW